MLCAFARVPVQDTLGEANKLLVERPAADSMPRRKAIRSSDDDIGEKAYMIHQPRYDRVVDWDVLAYPFLETELRSPPEPSHKANSDFCAAF